MRNRSNIVIFLVTVSLTILLVVPYAPAAKQPSAPITEQAACSQAEAYLKDGALNLAENKYTEVLNKKTKSECALAGLRSVAEKKCDVAMQLASAGDLEGAKNLFSKMLNLYPDMYCAAAGLEWILNREIEGLIKIGNYDEAWKRISSARAVNPKNVELKNLSKGLPIMSRRFYILLKEALKWLAIVFILTLVVWLVPWWLGILFKMKIDVGEFTLGSALLKKDANASPDPNKALQAIFEEKLSGLCKACRLNNPDMIDGPLQIPQLPGDFSSMPKEASDLWNFITKFIPDNALTIKGSLEYEEMRGAGLYVKLIHSKGNSLWASFTVWQSDVDPEFKVGAGDPGLNDYMRLVEPAAARAYWTIYKKHRITFRDVRGAFKYIEPGDLIHIRKLLERMKLITLHNVFGTEEVESHIYTQIALRQKSTNIDLMKKTLIRALTHDYKNYLARFTLATIEVSEADKCIRQEMDQLKIPDAKKEYENAVWNFEHVKRQTGKDQQNKAHFLANYWLGVIELYKYGVTKETQGNLARAEELLRQAVNGAKEAHRKNKCAITDELLIMLEIPYLGAQALNLVARVHTNPKKYKPKMNIILDKIENIENHHYASSRILYNLACFKSRSVQYQIYAGDPSDRELVENAVSHLKKVLKVDPYRYKNMIMTDPALRTLRDNKEKGKELLDMLKDIAPEPSAPVKPKSSSIADLVGGEAAAILQKANIQLSEDLLRETRKHASREHLAKQCYLNEKQLLQWARVVELTRIKGIDIGVAALFYAVGIESIDELKRFKKKERELLCELKNAKETRQIVVTLPESDKLARWIEEAVHMTSLVELS